MEPFKRNVSSKYGAPMGRPSDEVSGEVNLSIVKMFDGDYDEGGAYWGGGKDVAPLWCAWNDEGAQYLRAKDREEAKRKLPGCTFIDHGVDTFTRAYIECALWSSTDWSSDPDTGDEPLDANYSADDFAPATLARIVEDCTKFQTQAGELIAGDLPQAGHDFWLTRNGHGAGFWDGDWPKAGGDTLTKMSKTFGEVHLYVGDDGKIYI